MLTDPNRMQDLANRDFRDLASEEFDTRTLLRNAADQAIARKYEDFLIVDTDSHHYETEAFKEIAEYIDDPVMRYEAKFQGHSRGGFTSETGSYQETRRPHHALSAAQEREGADDQASRPHADGALDGRHGRRHGGDVSDADAQSVELSAHPGRGRDGQGLQPLALRQDSRRRSAHQVDALSAVPRSGGDLRDRQGVRRPQGRDRLHGDVDALQGELRQRLHEDLSRAAGARPAARLPRRLHLDRPEPAALQPLHRRARAGLHLVQHAAHDQLGHQRHAGALPEAEDGLDRERARLDSVPDAAPRQRVHDAHVGLRRCSSASRANTCARCSTPRSRWRWSTTARRWN